MKSLRFFGVALILTGITYGQILHGVQLADMDTSVQACDNFYDYANGTWRKNNPIPASMPRWSRRWEAGEKAKDRLRQILEDVSSKGPYKAGSVDQIVSDFYTTCKDEALLEKNRIKPIQPYLAQIQAAKTKAEIQRLIADFAMMGISAPFGMYGGQDNHAPQNVIAQIYASGLGLPDRDYYVKSEQRFVEARDKYREHAKKMFILSRFYDESAATYASKSFDLETQLAKASLDNVALRDPAATDHKMKFAELQKLTPNFNWTLYYKRLGVPAGDVNVNEPAFMKEFDSMLASRSVADWQAYLRWRLINAAAGSLSKELVEEDYAFNRGYLFGAKQMKPIATRCAEAADGLLGEAVGKKYVEKYFPPEAKARMTELVKNEIAAMGEIIRGLDWMSPATKQKALEKLSTLRPKIGYPDKWRDYGSLRITRASHAANILAATRFAVRDNLNQIGKPVDRDRWGMTPATSDAQYNPQLNDITFPAGILQPPAFFLDASDPLNYGAIGVVIGHEISHGYDDQGAQYDAQGRLNNWWSKEDLDKFQAKVACVSSQFEGYFIEPGIHHNGKLVLGESIADLAGAKIAYTALKIAERNKKLPDLDGFTPDQQFFIAWGQFRGDATRPETQRQMVQGDPHPIAKFRVIGPLSNLPVFATAFGCKQGAQMVRPAAERCEVW